MKEFVVPGQQIARRGRLENSFTEKEGTYSKVLGLYDEHEIVPLEGTWKANVGDSVVGIVTMARSSVCMIDIQSFVRGLEVLRKYENPPALGSVVSGIVRDVENRRTVVLERVSVLRDGVLMKVKPAKVPRLIGKSNTMINQISELTGVRIIVGMNGLVWIRGERSALAMAAITRICEEAHVPGLTMRIREMLEKGRNDIENKESA
jgi:exosome complex component RRP4